LVRHLLGPTIDTSSAQPRLVGDPFAGTEKILRILCSSCEVDACRAGSLHTVRLFGDCTQFNS